MDSNFRAKVEDVIRSVPRGRVITYGDIAALVGHPYASRVVGGVAHYGDPSLPWHRLVNRFGGLASGFHGGREVQKQLLESEGVDCNSDKMVVIEFKKRRWSPYNE